MTPNRSTAVMQHRAANPPDALDYFPTPPWATRALCEWLSREGELLTLMRAWEPACGEMHMAKPLAEYCRSVRASDVHQYGDNEIRDFLIDPEAPRPGADWIITNPPFLLAERFIHRARAIAARGVAMLVRSTFTESDGRYRSLFGQAEHLPTLELQFAERVVMLRGRLIRTGAPDPFNCDPNGQPRRASSATSYSWLIWRPGQNDWRKRVIPPCRTTLERPEDYPQYLAQWREVGRREQAIKMKGSML